MDHDFFRHLHGSDQKTWRRVAYHLVLKGKREIAERTWLFSFAKPDGFSYQAGQHVRMTLEKLSSRAAGGNVRFLSFASAPLEQDLTFALRMRPSAFKQELDRLIPGDRVMVEMLIDPPQGAFFLDTQGVNATVFIAGGIGIVPIFSMIKSALDSGQERALILFYCNRRPEDAAFLKDLHALAQQHPSFKFLPTMTASPAWGGATGRITKAMIYDQVRDPKAARYYIAGLEGMVTDTQSMLRRAGVSKTSIISEEFGAFAAASHARRKNRKAISGFCCCSWCSVACTLAAALTWRASCLITGNGTGR